MVNVPMISFLRAFSITILLTPSLQHPVPNERITKLIDPEPKYVSLEDIEGLRPLHRQKRDDPMGEGEGGEGKGVEAVEGEDGEEGKSVEEGEDNVALSPDTVETMKKINPLTIANQVSQMFKKGEKNSLSANRLPKGLESPAGDGDLGDNDPAVSGDVDEAGQQRSAFPIAKVDPPPKIVNKPKLKPDFGYSVVVLAGDAVKFPIKVEGHGVNIKTKNSKAGNQKGEISRNGEAEEKINWYEKNSDKDVRVSKELSENPNFPVYDDDINFDPDPFHGLLEQNYWKKDSVDKKPVQENYKRDPHDIQERSIDGEENVVQEKPCGEIWVKPHNATIE